MHFRLGQLSGQAIEQCGEGLVRCGFGGGVDARGRHHQRHHQSGGEPVRGHVAQHDANPAPSQATEGVEVTPDRVGRQTSRRHLGVSLKHGRRGQQLQLEIVRQLQLSLQPLLLQVSFDQPGVLDRRTNLVGHCTHQLSVVQGKAISADPVGQVDYADAAESGPVGAHSRSAR